MKKFIVIIEEHISQKFQVEAETLEEAMQTAEGKYHNGEFVVEPSPPTARLMEAHTDDFSEYSEWKEF